MWEEQAAPTQKQMKDFLGLRSGLNASVLDAVWEASHVPSNDEQPMSERDMHVVLRLVGIASEGLTPNAANLTSSAFSSRPGYPPLGVRFSEVGKWKLEVPDLLGHVSYRRYASNPSPGEATGGASVLPSSPVSDARPHTPIHIGPAADAVSKPADRPVSFILAQTSSIAWSVQHFLDTSPSGMAFPSATRSIAARLMEDRWLSRSKAQQLAVEACSLVSGSMSGDSLGVAQFASALNAAEFLASGLNFNEFYVSTFLPSWLAVQDEHVRQTMDAKASTRFFMRGLFKSSKLLVRAEQAAPEEEPFWSWRPSASLEKTYRSVFDQLCATSKASGSVLTQGDFARYTIYELRLPFPVARYAWSIADVTCDGVLDSFKFCIAHHAVSSSCPASTFFNRALTATPFSAAPGVHHWCPVPPLPSACNGACALEGCRARFQRRHPPSQQRFHLLQVDHTGL